MHFLWWIIVGLIAGWATGKIMRGEGYGPFLDIVIGIIGAIVGGGSCERWALPARAG
jgi:uncharacterized membrane protein YeaQ/YmgE (transglycosylase-associated protein family)